MPKQEALSSGFDKQDISTLKSKFDVSKGSVDDRKNAIDHAFREQLFNNVIGDIGQIEKFIDFSIAASRQEVANASLPVTLMSDIFDAVTLDQCEQIFTYVEDNVAVWREDWIFLTCKNNLLRICNDLLRRLSRSQNTVFCGRILLFLAKFFPFSERSGLNVVSEFNLENLTEYESSDGLDEKVGTATAGDGEAAPSVKIDYSLYSQFWALQDFFRNPTQCYNTNSWQTFVKVSLFELNNVIHDLKNIFFAFNFSSTLKVFFQHSPVSNWRNNVWTAKPRANRRPPWMWTTRTTFASRCISLRNS